MKINLNKKGKSMVIDVPCGDLFILNTSGEMYFKTAEEWNGLCVCYSVRTGKLVNLAKGMPCRKVTEICAEVE